VSVNDSLKKTWDRGWELEDEAESNIDRQDSKAAFAYQIGAGIGVPISDGIMLDARYRYFATAEIEDHMNVSSHSALLGLRVTL